MPGGYSHQMKGRVSMCCFQSFPNDIKYETDIMRRNHLCRTTWTYNVKEKTEACNDDQLTRTPRRKPRGRLNLRTPSETKDPLVHEKILICYSYCLMGEAASWGFVRKGEGQWRKSFHHWLLASDFLQRLTILTKTTLIYTEPFSILCCSGRIVRHHHAHSEWSSGGNNHLVDAGWSLTHNFSFF
jgi:hypothetical protein